MSSHPPTTPAPADDRLLADLEEQVAALPQNPKTPLYVLLVTKIPCEQTTGQASCCFEILQKKIHDLGTPLSFLEKVVQLLFNELDMSFLLQLTR